MGVMAILSLTAYFVCLFFGGTKQLKKEGEFLLVTSFYPMYVLAENLTAGVEGIEVANLTENQTGCLHDYQLTSGDMKLLTEADAFLVNGAGMELFIEKVIEQNAELPIIEASHGISLLEGLEHHHDHGDGEEPLEEEHLHEEESDWHNEQGLVENSVEAKENEEVHDHAHAENGHVWMDVERYRTQLSVVTNELQVLMPGQAEALHQAADRYDRQLQELCTEITGLKEGTTGMPVVIFHEAFAYLAESLGMEVLLALSLDEETVPSAGEIAEVIEEINYHGTAVILIEEAHAAYAEKIMAETKAFVVYLDPLTTGNGAVDSYLTGMRANLEAMKQAVK